MNTESGQLDEQEELKRGMLLAEVLHLKRNRDESIQSGETRYSTEWGTKSALGIYRTVKRIVEDGK